MLRQKRIGTFLRKVISNIAVLSVLLPMLSIGIPAAAANASSRTSYRSGYTTATATSVSLNMSSATIDVGSSVQLVAKLSTSSLTRKGLVWASDNSSVASVDNSGLVKGILAGTATVTVSTLDGKYKATCAVTVKQAVVAATSVALSQTAISLNVGGTQLLTATVSPANASNKNVTWGSSDTGIATVDSNGNVTAVSAGTAVVKTTTADGGYTASCTVTVAAASGSLSSAVSVVSFGAVPNDGSDDTAAIQSALDASDDVYIPSGTYLINVDVSLRPKSNQTITIAQGAVLKALPSANGYYNVIKIASVSNLTITGGTIIGDRDSHQGTSGEWGSGILIENASAHIKISNMTVKNCWGDGLLIGDNAVSDDIEIDNVVADNNRRQGMSICAATNVTVSNSIFRNTNGTAPSAGVDVEPNNGSAAESIVLTNIECYGNQGDGLRLSGWIGTLSGVTISGGSMHDNVQAGLYMDTTNTLSCSGTKLYNNEIGIDMVCDTSNAQFSSVTVNNNEEDGFLIEGSGQKSGISGIKVSSSSLYDNSQKAIGSYDGARISDDGTGIVGNIAFSGCKFYSDGSTAAQKYGLYVSSTVQNVTVTNCTFSGYAVAACQGVAVSNS